MSTDVRGDGPLMRIFSWLLVAGVLAGSLVICAWAALHGGTPG